MSLRHDSEIQRKRRYDQMIVEESKAEGWTILSPTAVCDRIGIKNGRVYLIELKKGKELTSDQRMVKSLAPTMYDLPSPLRYRSVMGSKPIGPTSNI